VSPTSGQANFQPGRIIGLFFTPFCLNGCRDSHWWLKSLFKNILKHPKMSLSSKVSSNPPKILSKALSFLTGKTNKQQQQQQQRRRQTKQQATTVFFCVDLSQHCESLKPLEPQASFLWERLLQKIAARLVFCKSFPHNNIKQKRHYQHRALRDSVQPHGV